MSKPWQMVCSLEITSKDGDILIGTGWIAGPRLVITAGHCVYHEDTLDGWAASIKVIPGMSETMTPPSYVSTEFQALEGWVNRSDENLDCGAIFLAEDVGSIYGTFSVGALLDEDLRDRLINISGYPGTRYGETQMHHENRIKTISASKLYYDIDTEPGQSGSPAWIYEGENLDPIVIGIHAYGAGNIPSANSGVRITASVLQTIEDWRKK